MIRINLNGYNDKEEQAELVLLPNTQHIVVSFHTYL